jgi:hypothetical protein
MKKWFILFAGVAALTVFTPATSMAQGIGIDLPGVGVRIGEPDRHYRGYYDGPRVYQAPRYREREVYSVRPGCRTVTIQRDDGSVKQIRRCD